MAIIGAIAFGQFTLPGYTYTREFYDSFPTTAAGLCQATHTPDFPGTIYWEANCGAFSITAHANMTPNIGPMVKGTPSSYQGTVINHGLTSNYRIRAYVGVLGTTGKNSDLEFGIVLRGATATTNSELDNCWVLVYKRKASAGTENDSTLKFERYAGTPGTSVENSSEVTCVGIDNLTGNWREIIIDDLNGTLTAYYVDAPDYVTSVTSANLAGNTYAGICSLSTAASQDNYLRNDFEVLSISEN